MANELPRFRELKGIGEASEERLYDAGVRSWHQLSQILVSLTSSPRAAVVDLRSLAKEAARRADLAGDDDDGERRHVFVVHLALEKDGSPARSWVIDTRSTREPAGRWAGWQPAELVSLMELRSGLVLDRDRPKAPAIASRRPAEAEFRGGDSLGDFNDVPPTPTAADVPATDDAQRARLRAAAGPPAGEKLTTLDLGTVVGGRHRPLDLSVTPIEMSAAGECRYEYRASLRSRAIGQGETKLLGEIGGSTVFDADLPLHFADVDLPRGLQRLTLAVLLRPPGPGLQLSTN